MVPSMRTYLNLDGHRPREAKQALAATALRREGYGVGRAVSVVGPTLCRAIWAWIFGGLLGPSGCWLQLPMLL